jgi:hypothetical protein
LGIGITLGTDVPLGIGITFGSTPVCGTEAALGATAGFGGVAFGAPASMGTLSDPGSSRSHPSVLGHEPALSAGSAMTAVGGPSDGSPLALDDESIDGARNPLALDGDSIDGTRNPPPGLVDGGRATSERSAVIGSDREPTSSLGPSSSAISAFSA